MFEPNAYVTDVSYPCHFHPQLQPLWLKTQACLLGIKSAKVEKGYRYCELGCATGINLLVSAYCHPEAEFVGVDFNAAHIAFAQQAAEELGLHNLTFICQDFAQFAKASGAAFDVVVCHGVWSWLSPLLQKSILEIAHNRLNDQGLFYLHYMAHPGASHWVNLQKLIYQLAQNAQGDSSQKLQAALSQAYALAEQGLLTIPNAAEHLKALQRLDARYLAHDFLAQYFSVAHSVDVHAELKQAGFYYLASANPWETVEALSIPRAMQKVLAQTQDPVLRELLKDHARNQYQRQDLFQKAPKVLSRDQQVRELLALRFTRLKPITAKVMTRIGPIELPMALARGLDKRLANASASLAELIQEPELSDHHALLQALPLLMSHGLVHPSMCQPVDVAPLNQWLARKGIALRAHQLCASALLLNNNEESFYAARPSGVA